MKKYYLIFLTILSVATASAAQATTVLVDEEWTCADNWSGGYQQIAKSQLPDLAAGDKIRVTVTAVSPTDSYPCVYLQYVSAGWSSWEDFAETDNRNVNLTTDTTVPYVAEFEMTQNMVGCILAGEALVVKGTGFTGNKVEYVHYDNATPQESLIWSGEKDMPQSWGAWETIHAEKFRDVKLGDILRFYVKNVSPGAQARLSTTEWTDMPDAGIVQIAGRYFQYTVTSAILAEIQANGMIVSGCNYTLTKVRTITASDLVDYRPNLSITQPDWTWTDTQPSISVILSNPGDTPATVPVEVEVTTDRGQAVATYTQQAMLQPGEENHALNVEMTDIVTPGIYRLSTYVGDDVVSYTRPDDGAYTWQTINIAYRPQEIPSPADSQSDFDDFWNTAKSQLAGIPIDAQLELVEEGATRNLYKVTLSSIPNGLSGAPVKVRGYYAEPTGSGQWPCIVNYMGYDSDGEGELWHPTADSNAEYAELIISPRGQSFANRAEYKSDNIYCTTAETTENIAAGKWVTWNFGNKETYYYRGAYMDQLRAIDFLLTRDKIDKDNIFVTGSSQGGAFTIVTAALYAGKINSIAPAIQFMGDFPDYFQTGSWPASECEQARLKAGMSEEEMYKFLSYFDTKNFAHKITAPTLSSIGLQDDVCPPHTNLAPFNLITAEKVLYINKNLKHEVPYNNTWSAPNNTERDWNEMLSSWWKQHSIATGISETKAAAPPAPFAYNLSGVKVSRDTKCIQIAEGKKILK